MARNLATGLVRLTALGVCFGGCGIALGLGDFTDSTEGGGGASSSGNASSGSHVGSGSTSASSGTTLCQAGKKEACYEGPDGTLGKGTCAAGLKTCLEDGGAYG